MQDEHIFNEEERAITEVLHQYEETLNKNDFDAWISLWADKGVQLPPNTPMRSGIKKISETNKPPMVTMFYDIKLKSIDYVRVSGNTGITICTYSLKLTPKKGGDTIISEPDGKALTVYEKQSDGKWKILYDCFNSNVEAQKD